jgi:hypothetical protein
MSPRLPTPFRATLLAGVVWAGSSLALPTPARAQVGPALLGAAGGVLVGGYTTLAIHVTKARFGRYFFSPDEVLEFGPATIPLFVAPVAGAWLGAESSTALARSAGWGALGFVGGAAVGGLTGRLVSDSDEAPWAGAIIGGGVGLLAGAVLGAMDGLDEPAGGAGPVGVSFSLPLGGG